MAVFPSRVTLPGLFSRVQDIFTRTQWGKSTGPTWHTWYRVNFDMAYTEEPAVVIVGVVRGGTLITKVIDKVTTAKVATPTKITATKVSATKVLAAKISAFEIPRIAVDDADTMGHKVGDAYYNEAVNRLGDWGWFNWARNIIASVAWGLGYITGAWINWMWTILVQPQIDKVRDAVNTAISNQTDNINSALSKQVDNINSAFSASMDNINSALSTQVDRINDRLSSLVDNINTASSGQVDKVIARVNAVLTDLYDSWGLPSGIIATPVHVRNVSTSGFEWQSFGGQTVYWIAVGKVHTRL